MTTDHNAWAAGPSLPSWGRPGISTTAAHEACSKERDTWTVARLALLADLICAAAEFSRSAGNVQDVLERVSESLLVLLDVDGVSISRFEPETGLLRTLFNGGLADPARARTRDEVYVVSESEQLTHLLVAGRSWAMLASDAPDSAEARVLRQHGLSAAAGAAVRTEGRVWGELYVDRADGRAFDPVDVALLEVVAAHIGALMAVWERADRQAANRERDNLTGLPLRRVAERAVLAHRHAVTLAALDVDGLKAVNDTYGHAAGDRLLQSVARALEGVLHERPDAVIARLGGDEFVIVVPGIDVHTWLPHLQRAMDEVSSTPLAGISCGVATSAELHADIGSGRPLFRLADAALYRAKAVQATRPLLSHEPVTETRSASHQRQGLTLPEVARFPKERLSEAVDAFAQVVDAAGWWITSLRPGDPYLRVEGGRAIRDGREEDRHDIGVEGDVYVAADYPVSVQVMRGQSCWVGLHDVHAPPKEQQLVAEMGYSGNLMAGATSADGVGWLVEVMCDDRTLAIDQMGPQLLGLIAAVGDLDLDLGSEASDERQSPPPTALGTRGSSLPARAINDPMAH
ncbi:MAG: GGDEF domain-containing protein [Angustibacter sp.]